MLDILNTHYQLLEAILRRIQRDLRNPTKNSARLDRDINQAQRLLHYSANVLNKLKNDQQLDAFTDDNQLVD